MKLISRRGLIIFAAGVVSVSVFTLCKSVTIAVTAAAVSALCAAALIIFPSAGNINAEAMISAALCVLVAGSGMIVGSLGKAGRAGAESFCDGKTHTVVGIVREKLYSEVFGSAYFADAEEIDGESHDIGVCLELGSSGDFSVGDRILFDATFSLPADDDASRYYPKGVFVVCDGKSAEVINEGAGITLAERINGFFDVVLREKLDSASGDFAAAIFLGNREGLSPKLTLDFRRSGVSHLLALSGLHLSIIAAGIDFLLRRLRIKKQIRTVILILSVAAFSVMTGLSASVFRAAIMLILLYIAQLLGEEKDALTALFFALAVILFVRPYAVWDAGLWMSFSATLGLVCFSGVIMPHFTPMKRGDYSAAVHILRSVARYVTGLLEANLIATLFTLPVTFLIFGGISLISPVTNFLLVPTAQIILYVLLLLCVMSPIPIVSDVLAFAAEKLIYFAENVAEGFSSIDGVYLSLRYPFTPYIIAALTVCTAILVLVPKFKKKYVFIAATAACLAFAVCLSVYSSVTENDIYAVCESDSSSDALGIVYRGTSIVIDVSTGGFAVPYSAAENTEGRSAGELDALVLTHLHKNHIRSVRKLTGYMKIDKLIVPAAESETDSEVIRGLASVCEASGTEIVFYNRRAESYLDAGGLCVTLPGYETLGRSTHPVITFAVSCGGERNILYVGRSAWETYDGEGGWDVVFFGSHGPAAKTVPEESFCRPCIYEIYSDGEIAALCGADGKTVVTESGGSVSILIEN